MQGKYEYKKLKWYDHMKPADIEIWELFLALYPRYFETCDYDYYVGEGVEYDDPNTNNYAKSYKMLTQKKIDVVGYNSNGISIIEVKPRAGNTAMGQVLGYKSMFLKQHPEVQERDVEMIILTDKAQPDYPAVYAQHGIKLIEVL